MHILSIILCFCVIGSLADDTKTLHIMQTSDIHGWVWGHRHDTQKVRANGTVVDLLSYKHHISEKLKEQGIGLLLVDSGDQVQGTGLSDAADIPGSQIWEILSKLGYDALTAGNHDLDQAGLEWFQNHKDQLFPDTYVTSNIGWRGKPEDGNASNELPPLGNKRYLALKESVTGLRILILGFIYNYDLPPSEVLLKEGDKWMAEEGVAAVREAKEDLGEIDLVLVLSHIPATDPLIKSIYATIRSEAFTGGDAPLLHEDTPLLFLAGHTHMWRTTDCRRPDAQEGDPTDTQCKVLEPGCYLWSFYDYDLVFKRHATDDRYILTGIPKPRQMRMNRATLATAAAVPLEHFLTEDAVALSQDIIARRDALHLSEVLGCSKFTYKKQAWFRYPYSFARLWQDAVLASVLQPDLSNNTILSVINSGSLRDSVYQGQVTVDDKYAVFPFADNYHVLRDLNGDEIYTAITGVVPEKGKYRLEGMSPPSNPHYMLSLPVESLVPDKKYDLVCTEYDSLRFEQTLTEAHAGDTGKVYKAELYTRPDGSVIKSSVVFEEFFKTHMQCQPRTFHTVYTALTADDMNKYAHSGPFFPLQLTTRVLGITLAVIVCLEIAAGVMLSFVKFNPRQRSLFL